MTSSSAAVNDVATKPAVAIFSTRIVCKYVKRELRVLTHEDKEQVLDAMAELWRNRQVGMAIWFDYLTTIILISFDWAILIFDLMRWCSPCCNL